MAQRAEALAKRLASATPDTDESRIRQAYLLLYSRPATDEEVALGLEFVKGLSTQGENRNTPSAWSQYSQALLAANEFLFVD
jgi:hypothetical protein